MIDTLIQARPHELYILACSAKFNVPSYSVELLPALQMGKSEEVSPAPLLWNLVTPLEPQPYFEVFCQDRKVTLCSEGSLRGGGGVEQLMTRTFLNLI